MIRSPVDIYIYSAFANTPPPETVQFIGKNKNNIFVIRQLDADGVMSIKYAMKTATAIWQCSFFSFRETE